MTPVTTLSDLFDRIDACDGERAAWYADPANAWESCPAGAGHLGWRVIVRGFRGGRCFAVETQSPRGWPQSEARAWADAIRNRAAERMAELDVAALAFV